MSYRIADFDRPEHRCKYGQNGHFSVLNVPLTIVKKTTSRSSRAHSWQERLVPRCTGVVSRKRFRVVIETRRKTSLVENYKSTQFSPSKINLFQKFGQKYFRPGRISWSLSLRASFFLSFSHEEQFFFNNFFSTFIEVERLVPP